MVIIVTGTEIMDRRPVQVISHGVDIDTGEIIVMQQIPVDWADYLKYDPKIMRYVLVEDEKCT